MAPFFSFFMLFHLSLTFFRPEVPFKKLTKSQLIKLLLKQEAQKPSNSLNKLEEIIKPNPPPRTGKLKSAKPKPVKRKNVNEDIILPPKQFGDRPPKPTRKSEPEPLNNFDDDIFQTKNTSHRKFKIISVQSRQNKKFKSFTNEFKVKIL